MTAAACRDDGGLDQNSLFDERPWLHQEVSHLPEKYRTAVVLCYFEGLTHDEAASRLGWPLGTVKGRLARARDLLRRRLTRRGVTISAAALTSQLAISDCHAAVPAALQLTTLTAARALAGQIGASLAATSVISIPVSALVEGALQAMFANQVKAIALPLLLVAGTVVTGITVGATQFGGGAQGHDQVAPAPASSSAKSKAQGHPPGPQPAPPTSNHPIGRAVSAELMQEMDHATTLFDRLLDALREPSIEAIDRLAQWSALTLQAHQRLSTAHTDRLDAAEAHRDRMKKLYLRIANLVGTDETQGLLKLTKIKLDEAAQILAVENEDKTRRSDAQPRDTPVAAETLKAPETPIDTPARSVSAATSPPAAKGMKAGGTPMAGMGGMMGMMGGAVGGMDPAAINRQIRPMIAGLAADLAARESDPKNKAILKKLEEPIAMSFGAATALEDVLKYIKQATTTPTYQGIPIYVDPKGLKEASATTTSPVMLDLEGVPLKTTLRLMLKQIGLAYCVRDGVLIISSVEGINEELSEAQREFEAITPGAGGFGSGGMGGMGGGLR